MASTNHTTNYSLSQFTQTDKPAWLGDYNQDMSKIDAGMKDNADDIDTLETTVGGHTTAIAGLTTDLGTAQGDITSLDTRVDTLEANEVTQNTAIQTAQTTANTADGKADTNTASIASQALQITSLQTDNTQNRTNIAKNTSDITEVKGEIQTLANEFSLSSVSSITDITGYPIFTPSTKITLAQSPHSAFFKLYGRVDFFHGDGSYTYARQAITGLTGVYGVKTTLQLTNPPESTYVIEGCGLICDFLPGQVDSKTENASQIAVDNQGYIWVDLSESANHTIGSWWRHAVFYDAQLYFNANFGDIVMPPVE